MFYCKNGLLVRGGAARKGKMAGLAHLILVTSLEKTATQLFTNMQIQKYTDTQIRKYTSTQIHKYTNTQIHKVKGKMAGLAHLLALVTGLKKLRRSLFPVKFLDLSAFTYLWMKCSSIVLYRPKIMFMDVIWTARAVKQIQFEVLNSILI